ncbi:hypothetical protein [Paenibacillus polymyxa]|uniref:hypothetical protein n=1 Tax=Paenibacillus polymyxa TaxID=1406 RepID=UPI0018691AD4|nr:hypothetical protein [Paenibacillus polymyxa]MBE3650936.1 hypothetical protein [Paenibacillus polymyxa]
MPTKIDKFHSPANIKDFESIPNQIEGWHETISHMFNQNLDALQEDLRDTNGTPQFYNPSITETADDMQTLDITWNAFPRVIQIKNHNNPDLYLPDADKLAANGIRKHDEYCEWHTERDQEGKVTRVTFTCEGPEYWQALAEGYPLEYTGPKSAGAKGSKEVLLALYQKYISPEVKLEDLLRHGTYNPNNKWNTTHGAMHLNQPNNTLNAEINIAARSTVLRKDQNGQMIDEATALVNCSKFGVPERFSDPTIGIQVNRLAQQGFSITLLDPIGLYISDLDTSGFDANGHDPKQFWTILRGKKGQILRAVYEVPSSMGFKVGDITIGGRSIEYGGQIAENITMKLTGVACRKDSIKNSLSSCLGAGNLNLVQVNNLKTMTTRVVK